MPTITEKCKTKTVTINIIYYGLLMYTSNIKYNSLSDKTPTSSNQEI